MLALVYMNLQDIAIVQVGLFSICYKNSCALRASSLAK
jgi:hypothetical protein